MFGNKIIKYNILHKNNLHGHITNSNSVILKCHHFSKTVIYSKIHCSIRHNLYIMTNNRNIIIKLDDIAAKLSHKSHAKQSQIMLLFFLLLKHFI